MDIVQDMVWGNGIRNRLAVDIRIGKLNGDLKEA